MKQTTEIIHMCKRLKEFFAYRKKFVLPPSSKHSWRNSIPDLYYENGDLMWTNGKVCIYTKYEVQNDDQYALSIYQHGRKCINVHIDEDAHKCPPNWRELLKPTTEHESIEIKITNKRTTTGTIEIARALNKLATINKPIHYMYLDALSTGTYTIYYKPDNDIVIVQGQHYTFAIPILKENEK